MVTIFNQKRSPPPPPPEKNRISKGPKNPPPPLLKKNLPWWPLGNLLKTYRNETPENHTTEARCSRLAEELSGWVVLAGNIMKAGNQYLENPMETLLFRALNRV